MSKKVKKLLKLKQKLLLNDRFVSTEQIRMIQVRIDHQLQQKSASLMITPAGGKTDKSLITAKLGVAMAQQGKKVLVVDADVRKPGVHDWFQADHDSGWTNAVLERSSIKGFVRETFQPNLYFLPAGQPGGHPEEVWVPDKMKWWIQECKKDFDVVLFDAPSFISVADPQVLVDYCEGVIVVARSNKTKKEDLVSTKESVGRADKKVLGVILQTG